MSNAIVRFIQSSFSIVASVFGFVTNRVDAKALEMKTNLENDINYDVLYKEYEQKVNEKLDHHANQVQKMKESINSNELQLKKDTENLQKTVIQINRAEDELKTINLDEMEYSERTAYEYALKNMRLEAKHLMSDISFLKNMIRDQQVITNEMVHDYHENKYHAKAVLGDLKSLQQRNSLIETKQSLETIELGSANFKLADLVRIVEGKESVYEAKKFTDTVLLRDGSTTADKFIAFNESKEADADLDNLLLEYRKTNTLNVDSVKKTVPIEKLLN